MALQKLPFLKQIDEPYIERKLHAADKTVAGSINQNLRTMTKLCDLLALDLYDVATLHTFFTNT